MKYLKKYQIGILISLVITGLLIVCFNTSIMRLAKTIYLIAKVSPYEQAVPGAPSILVLGDSTGYGTGASKSQDSIAGLVGKDFPEYSIKNNSQNGRTINGLLAEVEKLKGSYELILLQIGGNDILQDRDINKVEKELRQIIKNLEKHTDRVVMMSSGNVGGAAAFSGEKAARYENLTRDFRKMFLGISAGTDMVYVDLFLEPEVDPFIQDPKTYFACDGLHPSSKGYELWYQTLSPELKSRLR